MITDDILLTFLIGYVSGLIAGWIAERAAELTIKEPPAHE